LPNLSALRGVNNNVPLLQALVSKPKLILADESTGNLDSAKNRGGKVLYVETKHSIAGNLRSHVVSLWERR